MSGEHQPEDWELVEANGRDTEVFSEDPADYSEHLNSLRGSGRANLDSAGTETGSDLKRVREPEIPG